MCLSITAEKKKTKHGTSRGTRGGEREREGLRTNYGETRKNRVVGCTAEKERYPVDDSDDYMSERL